MTFSLLCEESSRYCIEYSNGTLHDVLTFELIVVICAVFAVVGYFRASALFEAEQATSIQRFERREIDDPTEVTVVPLSGSGNQHLLDSCDVQMTNSRH